jgi:hypothetical protein
MLAGMTEEQIRGQTEKLRLTNYIALSRGPRPAFVLDLAHFCPDICYKNSLIHEVASCDTIHLYEMVTWSPEAVEIWSQIESCGDGHYDAGPYKFSWEELQKSFEAKQDHHSTDLKGVRLTIPNESLDKLLRLRNMKYENEQDAVKISKLLRQKQ